jgi:hypothetical protein
MKSPLPITPEIIAQAHALYGQLTAQSLSLRFDRERAWFEWFRGGFDLDDLRRVVRYLQREIREGRRNVGALKLSNLLQPDRFEEDLHISRVSLYPQKPSPPPLIQPSQEQIPNRQLALDRLRKFRQSLE